MGPGVFFRWFAGLLVDVAAIDLTLVSGDPPELCVRRIAGEGLCPI